MRIFGKKHSNFICADLENYEASDGDGDLWSSTT
jgi:hypothetical protein